jgi:hypothetical protein
MGSGLAVEIRHADGTWAVRFFVTCLACKALFLENISPNDLFKNRVRFGTAHTCEKSDYRAAIREARKRLGEMLAIVVAHGAGTRVGLLFEFKV